MGETIEKVRYLQRKLESYSGEEFPKIIAVLQKLDRLPITIQVLQGTGIGKVVNTFRKHDEGISEHARNLVKKWKALVQAAMDAEAEVKSTNEIVNEKKESDTHTSNSAKDKDKQNKLNSSDISDKTENPAEQYKPLSKSSKNISDKNLNSANSKTLPKPSKPISSPPKEKTKHDGDVESAKTPDSKKNKGLGDSNKGLSSVDLKTSLKSSKPMSSKPLSKGSPLKEETKHDGGVESAKTPDSKKNKRLGDSNKGLLSVDLKTSLKSSKPMSSKPLSKGSPLKEKTKHDGGIESTNTPDNKRNNGLGDSNKGSSSVDSKTLQKSSKPMSSKPLSKGSQLKEETKRDGGVESAKTPDNKKNNGLEDSNKGSSSVDSNTSPKSRKTISPKSLLKESLPKEKTKHDGGVESAKTPDTGLSSVDSKTFAKSSKTTSSSKTESVPKEKTTHDGDVESAKTPDTGLSSVDSKTFAKSSKTTSSSKTESVPKEKTTHDGDVESAKTPDTGLSSVDSKTFAKSSKTTSSSKTESVPKEKTKHDGGVESAKTPDTGLSSVDSKTFAKSSKTTSSSKTASVPKEKQIKKKVQQSSIASTLKYDDSGKIVDKVKKKLKPPPVEDEGIGNENTGLSFADCLGGSSPATKPDKLKPKGSVDRQKRKIEDGKRIEKNGSAIKAPPTKSNNIKTLKNESNSSLDDEIHRKDKTKKNVEETKNKIEQKVKSTVHKSGIDRKTDIKTSEVKRQSITTSHQSRRETDSPVEATATDSNKLNAILSQLTKTLSNPEKTNVTKIKKDDAMKKISSQQHTTKTTVEVKNKDKKQSEKKQVEKPKEKLDVKDRVKKEKKRVYSSGDESEDDICFENTGLSFSDCLFGGPPTITSTQLTTKSKKKKTVQQKSNVIKEKHPTRSEDKQDKKTRKHKEDVKVGINLASNTMSDEVSKEKKRKLLNNPMETPSLKKIKSCYDKGILLPEITPDYKPLPRLGDDSSPRKRSQAQSEDHQIQFKGAKESRTKVFSGKARVFLTAVPTLFDACMRILCDNIDLLEDVGGVPFDILKPVMERCTYHQLYRLEEYNPHFIEDSDYLWQKHVEKEFKVSRPSRAETWKECYMRSFDEREQKFKLLTENITSSYAKKDTGRKVMLAYVDRPAKAPRNIRRKQEQNGTAGPVTPHEAFASPHKRSPWAVPRNEDTFNPSSKPARTTKIIAPMMQKTLRFIKKLQKR